MHYCSSQIDAVSAYIPDRLSSHRCWRSRHFKQTVILPWLVMVHVTAPDIILQLINGEALGRSMSQPAKVELPNTLPVNLLPTNGPATDGHAPDCT